MNKVEEHTERGYLLLDAEKLESARAEFAKALVEAPDHTDAHVGLAQALCGLRDLDGALRHCGHALSSAPEDTESYLVFAWVYLEHDRPGKALDWVAKALEKDASSFEAMRLKSRAHSSLQEWSHAADAAESALALNPTDGSCAGLLAAANAALSREGGDRAGPTRFEFSDTADDADTLGFAALEALFRGDIETAVEQNLQALALNPSSKWIYQNLLYSLRGRLWGYKPVLLYFTFLARRKYATALTMLLAVIIGALGVYLWDRSIWGPVLAGAYLFYGAATFLSPALFNLFLLRGDTVRFIKRPLRVQAIAVWVSVVVSMIWSAYAVLTTSPTEPSSYLPLGLPLPVEATVSRSGKAEPLGYLVVAVAIVLVASANTWPQIERLALGACFFGPYLPLPRRAARSQ